MTDPDHATQLATLLDERDIVAVATLYCRALDTKQFDLLSSVFAPDATANLGRPQPVVGLDALKDRIERALQHLDESQHLIGNHEVAIDGDNATHRCYVQAQHIRADAVDGSLFIVAGRYEDTLARTVDGWRITYRNLIVMWTDGNSAVPKPT